MSWIDGNPLVYTEWFNPESHQLYEDESSEYTWTKTNMIPKQLDNFVSSTLKQPINNPDSKCTIMFPYMPYTWGNWALVPCNLKIRNVKIVCKHLVSNVNGNTIGKDIKQATIKENLLKDRWLGSNVLTRQNLTCPLTWTFYRDKCLSLESSIFNFSVSMNNSMLESMCSKGGGRISHLDVRELGSYSNLFKKIWKHDHTYGQIVTRDKKDKTCMFIKVQGGRIFSTKIPSFEQCNERNVLCEHNVISAKYVCFYRDTNM